MPIPTIILLSMGALAFLCAIYFGAGILFRSQADRRAISLDGRGMIALSYDDGPGAVVTPKLLDLLARHDATATFFLVGVNARLHPDVVSRIAEEGHAVGWHSETHLNQWKCLPLSAWRDTWRIPKMLQSGTVNTQTYRPPFGKMNALSVLAAKARGLAISTWSVVSFDTERQPPAIDAIVKQIESRGGAVVLMHDNDRDSDTANQSEFTLQLTESILTLGHRRGWKFVPVPELMEPL